MSLRLLPDGLFHSLECCGLVLHHHCLHPSRQDIWDHPLTNLPARNRNTKTHMYIYMYMYIYVHLFNQYAYIYIIQTSLGYPEKLIQGPEGKLSMSRVLLRISVQTSDNAS